MAATAHSIFPAVSSLSSTTNNTRARGPTGSNFFSPNFVSKIKPSRLRISRKIGIVPNHVFRAPIACCLDDEATSESVPVSAIDELKKEAAVDLKLPRRSLLVHFTCNACGERTQKLINRLAYERGTVFVQCTGCLQHHKLIDNLGLVVEYDFREENEIDSNADQV
ncbi:uncharacterized protein LOC130766237 isoform X1 [Actinidia eriantha]|uniref:uncharacterized protein LOC130766237 isoform X1 n=1 Tax=Actinidia eriantha TaxID=165200 RepID=UPI00258CD232|nr:uncharacterized protein LOC130766237 isoform X1 [Actinidia eriantha]